ASVAQNSQAAADALASVALASQATADTAAADATAAQNAADAAAQTLGSTQAAVDTASQALLELPTQLGLDFEVNELSLAIPNVMPDLGDTASFNGFLTLFGQFFDHGLDLVSKGGSGTVYMPLLPDDPLYVEGSPTNFMVLTRATNQPGADGVLGTGDDIREHNNETTPFIDLNQVYTSHESHQVFLREYARVEIDGVLRTVATGHMLEGAHGGPPTWADIKAQALDMLGIQLTDLDVHRVPLVAADLYGKFIPGANGYAQLVTSAGLIEGDPGAPALASSAIGAGRAFLNDIAHSAAPGVVDDDRDPTTAAVVTTADADSDTGNAIPLNGFGVATTYDNELLDQHFIVGDGRGNENIGLTAVHHVFHSEHNTRIEQIQHELIASGDLTFLNQWLLVPVDSVPDDPTGLLWNGERLFQAARFSTEMVYQHLVFEEFARLISPDVDPFLFSNSVDIDPAIVAEFAHVVYRFGHSMLTETVDRLGADGQTSDNIGLIEAFLDPVEYVASGVDSDESAGAIIRGMSRQVGNEIDEFLTEALRNNLVGLPLDLGALNIARGRDTGVPSLNEARRQFFEQTNDTTLKPYESWFDFALAIKHPASIINFIAAYGTHGSITAATTLEEKRDAATLLVLGGEGAPADRLDFLNATNGWAGGDLGGLNQVDFWIGGLAEKKMAFGGQLGTTFNFVFEVQMEQLQDGDRFYYLSRAQGMNLLNQLEADSFAELVMRNTDLGNPNATHLPSSLFLTPDHILELDQARQKLADPTHDNAILDAISPMVIRQDTDSDGVDDYLRYTGGDHVVLGGTEQDNTLIGGEGDDTLWGDGGNDRLEGGFGVDHLFGGAGDDILTDSGTDSGAADVIHGDDGNDVINGGNGLDLIFGGRGQDFIFGGVDGKTITAGEGNDFVRGPDGLSFVAGNEGDDWLEGGDSFDTLAGENTELFFNSTIIGHDVLNGRGNDNDYDAESGDDIMFQGTGIQRNNGMAGFDWAIHKGAAQGADSDLGIPIFVNQQANILRDRFDLVEGLSGWEHDDILTGREVIIGAYDEEAGAAAQFNPDSPFASYANALLQSGVDRIEGLDVLVAHLNRVTFTAAGKQETAIVFDESAVERDAAGNAITIYDTAADILLGGGGSDILQGKAGNDIIDGDRWLNVRIGINDAQGNAIAWADDLGSKVYSLTGDELYGGRSLDNLMFDRTLNPGQLSIERMILDGDSLNAAVDTAVYRGLRSEYAFTNNDDGSITVAHLTPQNNLDDGTDRLFNIERLVFGDGTELVIGGPNTLPDGPLVITGLVQEDETLFASVQFSDVNGLGPMTFTWQMLTGPVGSEVWVDVGNEQTFVPGDAQVGQVLRAVATYTDTLGYEET
ncbi:MAG: heme peroxidase, partial [Alphaproteobacteria bacterium HGW-Alphaproteobacteria-10]